MSGVITLEEADRRLKAKTQGIVRPHTLQNEPVPERRWLVRDLIPRGAVTMLSGDGGVGKSLLALQLMTAGAISAKTGGGKWIGIDVPAFSSFGFFCEDDKQELHRRQAAINEHFGCDFSALERAIWWPRVGVENVMVQYSKDSHAPPRLNKPYREVEKIVREEAIELIVIDTVADVFGGNENFRAEVRSFIAHMRELARINDGAVLLMAHPSVAGQASGTGLSGSTAWNNSVRSRLYLTRPKNAEDDDEDCRELRGMKSNYGATGSKLKLKYEAGAFVRLGDGGYDKVTAIEQNNLTKRFVQFVATMAARDIYISPNYSAAYAPNVMCDMNPDERLSQQALRKAMYRALHDGLVSIVDDRIDGRTRKRIVPVPQMGNGT